MPGGAFQFLLDTVGDRNFVREHLQAGHLLVGLVGYLLQPLIARAQGFHFVAQRVVVGNLPGHARVTGNEAEYRDAAEQGQSHHGVDHFQRNANAAQLATQGMG